MGFSAELWVLWSVFSNMGEGRKGVSWLGYYWVTVPGVCRLGPLELLMSSLVVGQVKV